MNHSAVFKEKFTFFTFFQVFLFLTCIMDMILQRQIETVHFMQVVPWLGVVPNKEGQLQQLLADDNLSPLVSIFKQATDEVVASCENASAFVSMAKQAQVAGMVFFLDELDKFSPCSLFTFICVDAWVMWIQKCGWSIT